MHFLFTPPKRRITTALLTIGVLGSPMLVAAYLMMHNMRGDYGATDVAMLTVVFYTILIFPLTLLMLVVGLQRYTAGIFLFAWNTRRFWSSSFWTLVSLAPMCFAGFGITDAVEARIYWAVPYCLAFIYCLAVLRACLVSHVPRSRPNYRWGRRPLHLL